MPHSLWDDKSLSRRKLDRAVFKVNQQLTINNIKEFVLLLVVVPMILTLYNPEPDDRIIHLAESLVVPRELARICKRLFIDYLQGLVQNVQARFVGERRS